MRRAKLKDPVPRDVRAIAVKSLAGQILWLLILIAASMKLAGNAHGVWVPGGKSSFLD